MQDNVILNYASIFRDEEELLYGDDFDYRSEESSSEASLSTSQESSSSSSSSVAGDDEKDPNPDQPSLKRSDSFEDLLEGSEV